MSEIEFAYLNIGARTLPLQIFKQIDINIEKIKAERLKSFDEKFLHCCPFLINNRCSLYRFRPIICRSHGLAFFGKDDKIMVPNCVDLGLNYSNVYDTEKRCISSEMFKQTGNTQEPLAHNIRLGFLTDNDATNQLDLNYGEIKPLINWFMQ